MPLSFRKVWVWAVWLVAISAAVISIPLAFSADVSASTAVMAIPPIVGGATMGAVLCTHVPRNPIGPLILTLATAFALSTVGNIYLAPGLALPAGDAVAAVYVLARAAPWVILPALLLLFPEGRLPSPRWRPVGWVWAVASLCATFGWEISTESIGLGSDPSRISPLAVHGAVGSVGSTLGSIGTAVLLILMVAATVSLVLRFRRSTGVLRQQLKWFGAAAAGLAVAAVVSPVLWALGGIWSDDVDGLLWSIAGTALVIATGIAVLRYRLYEIDVLIRKTLVYTALVATLAVLYLGGISLTGWMFRSVTGQSSALAVTLSTLAVALAFQPARRRIQRAVDHRFYRRKYDANVTLEAFSGRLRQEIDLEALNAEVLEVVRETLQPSFSSVWLRSPH